MPTILARPASPFSFFGDLIAQPPLTALARVEATLGRKMIEAEVERCSDHRDSVFGEPGPLAIARFYARVRVANRERHRVQVAVLGGRAMTAEEIRKSQSDVTTMAESWMSWTDSSASANATLLLHVFRMLAEIAAQLAELNEQIGKGRLSPIFTAKFTEPQR